MSLENGLEICSCKRTKCKRFGDCAACIAHHKTHKKNSLPYCKRHADKPAKRNIGQEKLPL